MRIRTIPEALSADQLMEAIRQLSVVIGPRRPTSPAEHDAAEYIRAVLQAIEPGWTVTDQSFRSVRGFSYRIMPLALLGGLSLLLGLRRDRQSRLLGGITSIGLSVLSRDAFLGRAAMWETWLPRGESENIVVRIPPRRRATRRVVFVAHMDAGLHRLTAEPHLVQHLPRTLGGITLLALTGGVLTLLSGSSQRWRGLRTLMAGAILGGAALAVLDEMGPDIAGANGNASGVATLLGLAGALHAQPLTSTEVVLAFTGSATAVTAGVDRLATTYGEEWRNALWIVVNNVGVGELAWATRHGISPYAYYYPHPDAVQVMEQVAEQRPDLGLMGKPMTSIDEVANLRDRDLRVVGLVGYDRVTGLIPHWRQISDTIHEIDPATLERAAHTLWTATQVIDRAETWPLDA